MPHAVPLVGYEMTRGAAIPAWVSKLTLLEPHTYDSPPVRGRCDVARHVVSEQGGAWRSLVAHLLWEQRVGGSNPSAPTITRSRGDLSSACLTVHPVEMRP